MLSLNDHQTTFLASAYDPPIENFFQGYCFVGADLIFGHEGAQKYEDYTGNTITAGLDGCYVKITRSSQSYIFETDFAGYKALYYFHDGTTWVVSNSFAKIVEFLSQHKISVSPNYPHLAAIASKGMAADQLFSFATIVKGVRVLPPAYSLVVTPQKAVLERQHTRVLRDETYEKSLAAHLDLWIRRFETLMLDETVNFTTDVTGGVDSRANLALVIAAQRRLNGEGTQPRLNCGSTPDNRSDLEIAELLTEHYSLELNDSRRFETYRLSAEESYSTFKNLSLGVYYPLYLPDKGPTPTDISINGGGGGIHRKVYEHHQKSNDVSRFVRNSARRIGRPEFQLEFIRDAQNMLNLAVSPGDDPLRILLRDGRVRYHTGRSARFGVSFSPLHSVSAHTAQALAGIDRTDDGQFNYDIMHSVDPELPEIPYDKPGKGPTDAIRTRLVAAVVSKHATPGRVWVGDLHLNRGISSSRASRVKELKKAFDKATTNPFVTSFWDRDMLTRAKELMSLMDEGRSIGNAANGKPIHAVLAADLATPL